MLPLLLILLAVLCAAYLVYAVMTGAGAHPHDDGEAHEHGHDPAPGHAAPAKPTDPHRGPDGEKLNEEIKAPSH